jgi:hypothetical protein
VPASYNVHPEFGFLCLSPRFHRVCLVLAALAVAGLGAAVLVAIRQEMTTNRVDLPPVAVTMPAMTVASPQGAQAPGFSLHRGASNPPSRAASPSRMPTASPSNCASRGWCGWRPIVPPLLV